MTTKIPISRKLSTPITIERDATPRQAGGGKSPVWTVPQTVCQVFAAMRYTRSEFEGVGQTPYPVSAQPVSFEIWQRRDLSPAMRVKYTVGDDSRYFAIRSIRSPGWTDRTMVLECSEVR